VIPWEGMPRTRPVVMAGCLDRLGFVLGWRLWWGSGGSLGIGLDGLGGIIVVAVGGVAGIG